MWEKYWYFLVMNMTKRVRSVGVRYFSPISRRSADPLLVSESTDTAEPSVAETQPLGTGWSPGGSDPTLCICRRTVCRRRECPGSFSGRVGSVLDCPRFWEFQGGSQRAKMADSHWLLPPLLLVVVPPRIASSWASYSFPERCRFRLRQEVLVDSRWLLRSSVGSWRRVGFGKEAGSWGPEAGCWQPEVGCWLPWQQSPVSGWTPGSSRRWKGWFPEGGTCPRGWRKAGRLGLGKERRPPSKEGNAHPRPPQFPQFPHSVLDRHLQEGHGKYFLRYADTIWHRMGSLNVTTAVRYYEVELGTR